MRRFAFWSFLPHHKCLYLLESARRTNRRISTLTVSLIWSTLFARFPSQTFQTQWAVFLKFALVSEENEQEEEDNDETDNGEDVEVVDDTEAGEDEEQEDEEQEDGEDDCGRMEARLWKKWFNGKVCKTRKSTAFGRIFVYVGPK